MRTVTFVPYNWLLNKVEEHFRRQGLKINRKNIDRMLHENLVRRLAFNVINNRWYVEKERFEKFDVDKYFQYLYKIKDKWNEEHKIIIREYNRRKREGKRIPFKLRVSYESIMGIGSKLTPSGYRPKTVRLKYAPDALGDDVIKIGSRQYIIDSIL